MAKRQTDTTKWDDPWFCSLSNADKLFWFYICDRCDHAGIWKVNMPLLKFHLGDYEPKLSSFNGRIRSLRDDKWFVEKFIAFQYGTLTEKNKMYGPVSGKLAEHGLNMGDICPIDGSKRIIQSKRESKRKRIGVEFVKPSLDEVRAYCKEKDLSVDPETFFNTCEASGWTRGNNSQPIANWKSYILVWQKKQESWDKKAKNGDNPLWNTKI